MLHPATYNFVRCINSIDGRSGTLRRVIMTDGVDCIVAEWTHEEGMVFPPKLKGMQLYVKAPEPRLDQALEDLTPSHISWNRRVLSIRSTPQ